MPFLQKAEDIDLDNVSDEFVDQVLEASFEKYFHMGSLLGTYEKCLDTIDSLSAIGVDEVA